MSQDRPPEARRVWAVLERIRQPEYTGENRCVPCMVVNVAIGASLGCLVGVAVLASGAGRLAAATGGFVSLAVSAAAIYLRGYLVPGTPHLTRTYLPESLLRRFDPHGIHARPSREGDDVESVLRRAGIVTDCEHGDDLCLTDEFRTAWRVALDDAGETDASNGVLGHLLDADPERLTVDDRGGAVVVRLDGDRAGHWPSRAALLADLTAAAELDGRVEGWTGMDAARRTQLLSSLRIFLERCPACDGPVGLGEDVVESCCRSIDVVAVTCADCEARLFEVERVAVDSTP